MPVDKSAPNDGIPRSFVFKRGKVSIAAAALVKDIRQVFQPYGFMQLKVRKGNNLKDFTAVSGILGATHMTILTSSGEGTTMRIIKLPAGPTLTFRLKDYSTIADMHKVLKTEPLLQFSMNHPSLCITAGFKNQSIKDTNPALFKALDLCKVTIQGMYPELNVAEVSLRALKRCVLYSANDTGVITFRHYLIRQQLDADTEGIKVLLGEKRLSLGHLDSIDGISTLKLRDPKTDLDLFFKDKPVKLTEIGPRYTMELIKIESGLTTGLVLYHAYITKTEEQIAMTEKKARETRGRLEKEAKREVIRRRLRVEREKKEHARLTKEREKNADNLASYAAEKAGELSEPFMEPSEN